jgi:energy-coupling factor transport system substrate-specific component
VGVKLLAAAAAALAIALASPTEHGARYLESRQVPGGGFAEPGSEVTPGLTAWATLGLRAAGRPAPGLEEALAYLGRADAQLRTATDLELVLLARAALGDRAPELVERVRALRRPSGYIGPTLNSTIWGVLALRAAGDPAPAASVRLLLRRQHRSGGWSWAAGGAPDSNDTAAAVQALRAADVHGRPIARALAFLRRHQRPDGGFELTRARGSDVQSTAWAVQAFVAAGERAPPAALRYLLRMQRPDGSFRYSARYAVTPVWVTSQALAALARKPLPLR